MREEFFRVVEELDDWMAARSADPDAREAAVTTALGALRSGLTYDEAFARGVRTFQRMTAEASGAPEDDGNEGLPGG